MRSLLVLVAGLLLMGTSCQKKYDGVYLTPEGFNVLITCETETMPNDREILFCSGDDRGVW